MSLDITQLPVSVLQELYKTSLVEFSNDVATLKKTEALPVERSFLGKNKKHIVVLVDNNEAAFLPEEQFAFLTEILSACTLTIEDVAILNLQKNQGLLLADLVEDFATEKILLFGVTPVQIGMPIDFLHYQLQVHNSRAYLASPALDQLQHNKTEKAKLWACLKELFGL